MLPKFQTKLQELSLLQSQWSSLINPLLGLPLIQGITLKEVVLATGSNTIDHRLGRALQGWFIVRQRSVAAIYDNQDNNISPSLSLLLVSSAPVTVDIFVY